MFIPDGHPGQQHQDTVGGMLIDHPDLKAKMPFEDLNVLASFQRVHDQLNEHLPVDAQKQILIDFVVNQFEAAYKKWVRK